MEGYTAENKMTNPKFILSKSKAISQYNKVKSFSDIVSYSSKTNPLITKILEENTDSLFSVHLMTELKNIKDKSRVVFLSQALNQETLKNLTQQGVKSFIVDNESDLSAITNFLETNEVEIDLMLRLKLKENTLRTERYFVFGMDSDTINKKIPELRNNKKIKQLGIHFHRKSQNMSEWNLVYEVSDTLEKETLEVLDVICIGGGLPSEYANTNVDVVNGIFNKIKEFKIWLKNNNIKLIIEPGRFIAAPSIKLETKIIGIHENNIIVDVSVYNSDMDALIVPVKLLIEGELEKGTPYVIKGVTPCSMDLFRYKVYLNNPKIGDKLTFLNAGAYSFTTDFCDLEKIQTEIVD
ncbi:MAG: decarboxylase [Nanoarchaeota archaeon]